MSNRSNALPKSLRSCCFSLSASAACDYSTIAWRSLHRIHRCRGVSRLSRQLHHMAKLSPGTQDARWPTSPKPRLLPVSSKTLTGIRSILVNHGLIGSATATNRPRAGRQMAPKTSASASHRCLSSIRLAITEDNLNTRLPPTPRLATSPNRLQRTH